MNRRQLLALTGGTVMTAIAGCSGDDGGDEETPEETPTEEPTDTPTPEPTDTPTPEPTATPTPEIDADVTIDVVSNEFQPNYVEVEAGATIEWAGQSGAHTVTFYHEDNDRQHRVPEGVDALDENVSSGESAVFEFSEPGIYDYHCKPHEGQGMVGSIVVGQPAGADQPGLQSPAGSIPSSASTALESLNERARDSLGIVDPDYQISVVSNEFETPFLQVSPGEVVQWVAEEGEHTVTFYSEANGRQHRVPQGVDSLDAGLSAGSTASYEFSEPGIYDYHCRPHEGQGMVGTIVVGENDSPDQPGLKDPGEDIPDAAAQALDQLNFQTRDALGIPLEDAFQIDVVSNEFQPNFASIPVDTTVQWLGQGGSHTVTFYHADNDKQQRVPEGVDALDQSISAEGTVEYEFSTPGVYDYFCRPHEGQGMVGSLVVGENADPSQPGLQAPADDLPDAAQQALTDLNEQAFDALGIVTVAKAVTQANETIDTLNNDPDGSLSSVNESLENVEPVPLIDSVEAETEAEATSEADRLRNEIDRVEEDLFTQVPKEINAQAQEQIGSDLVEVEEITDAESARSSADSVEALNEDAAEALRATADIMDKIEEGLTQAADLLEEAVAA